MMVIRLVAVTATGWLVATLLRGGAEIAPSPGASPRDTSTALAALVVDVTAGMVLTVGAWVALAALVGAATSIPGRAGRLAAVAWAWMVPRAARAALAAVVGVGATAAPAMAVGSGPLADDAALASRGTDQVPLVARPTTQGAWSDGSPAPAATPTGTASPASTPDTSVRHGQKPTVTVRAGDSLWTIAARRLGPASTDAQVAAEWPRWYAANRATIGPDPDLLLTGTVLTVPGSGERR